MMRWNKKTRLLLVAGVALVMAGGLVGYRYGHTKPQRYEFTTQRPGEPRQVWRSMRVAWTFLPGLPGYHHSISDLYADDKYLYYACECETGCVDKASGRLVWQHRFITQNATENANSANTDRTWRISRNGRFLYACECVFSRSAPFPATARLCALDVQTGEVLWEHTLHSAPREAPFASGSLLFLPTASGSVLAVRQRDGETVWERKLTVTTPKSQETAPDMMLRVENGIGVVQIGTERLVGFRAEDGKPLWSTPAAEDLARAVEAERNFLRGFALQDGVVYAFLYVDTQIALQAATGKKLWERQPNGGWSPGLPVSLLGDVVLTQPVRTLVALRRSNGATAWFQTTQEDYTNVFTDRESGGSNWQNPPHARQKPDTLFVTANCPPILNGAQRALRSVQQLDTLIALDTATGRERWRWQPYTGFSIRHLVADKDRFYLSDGERLFAFEEGLPNPLPTDARRRALLSQRMTTALYGWPEPKESLLRRAVKYLPGSQARSNLPEEEDKIASNEASLTLLRLGRDSVPTLLDYIHHAVTEGNRILSSPNSSSGGENKETYQLQIALDILFDIDAPQTLSTLAHELDSAKDSDTRWKLAKTLIRWGDLRALPALFRYAQSNDPEPNARPSALYFVCRSVAAGGPDLPADAPRQEAITAYLLARLQDKKAPGWLRRFAKFELLNGRGDAARHAALATFRGERTARLLSTNPTLRISDQTNELYRMEGFPTGFQPKALCRDANGRWWAAFYCDYLSNERHLWFAQSTDKQHWTKPAFAFNLDTLCSPHTYPENITLSSHQGRLRVGWVEKKYSSKTGQTHVYRIGHQEIPLTDLYRDRDHDGLTDRLEKEIGTDPNNPDTNGNGIPDGMDKNPLYKPHRLTDEEGILQATMEAICQYGRSIPFTRDASESSGDEDIPFGRSANPLLVFTPPGSAGIEIRGHPGMVFCRPLSPKGLSYPGLVGTYESSFHFHQPFIGLDGRWQKESHSHSEDKPTDPFAPLPAGSYKEPPLTFRTYFPYVRSSDGKRARICIRYGRGGDIRIGFDIEVQKIGGQWRPAECWLVDVGTGNRVDNPMVVPIRNPRDPAPVFAGPNGL